MLEIRGLTKIYHSKTGESVRALDGIDVSFPETGMVFILGKSGSGKSTLLNVMGGLDSYDEGEFIIKGKSSKEFVGSDFDAYRNTFIGFIFQEYNILDDFTVGANIGLALELQGQKADAEKINRILEQVELLHYANRKPNELSGGQKQRIAIARALVKDPQIIMADEPTGALDSNTGKQIFDTLKALSKDKLVLIVSHDRDFAERYADRIIELADGRIIEDVTKHAHTAERISDGVHRLNDNMLRIEGGYKLTAKDLDMINAYLAKASGDVLLSGDGRINEELRSAAGISKDGSTTVFEETVADRDIKLKQYEKKDTRFIRSRLPMKNAVKMGASGLRHKKFRLVMTIFLSFIAFAMFGLTSTVAAYENISAATSSIIDSNVRNASVSLRTRVTRSYSDGDVYIDYESAGLNDEDIQWLREHTGLDFVPVYTGSAYSYDGGFALSNHFLASKSNDVYNGRMAGVIEISADALGKTGFRFVVGGLPQAQGEIAITELLYRQFKEFGFTNNNENESVPAGELTAEESGAKSILGKHITLNTRGMYGESRPQSYEIVGVVDTGFDYARYESFLPSAQDNGGEEGSIFDMVLQNEIRHELSYGYHMLGFMTQADIDALSAANGVQKELGEYMSVHNYHLYLCISSTIGEQDGDNGMMHQNQIGRVASSKELSELGGVTWLDGRADGTLKANEVLISKDRYFGLFPQEMEVTFDKEGFVRFVEGKYGEGSFAKSDTGANYLARATYAKAIIYVDGLFEGNDNVYEAIKQKSEMNLSRDEAKEWLLGQMYGDEWFFMEYGVSSDMSYHWESTKSFATLREEVRLEMLPFIEQYYGIEIPEMEDTWRLSSFTEVLSEVYDEDLEFTFRTWDLQYPLSELYAEYDVQTGRLWENEAFVDLLIQQKYNGIDSKVAWNDKTEDEQRNTMTWFYREAVLGYLGVTLPTGYTPSVTQTELDDLSRNALLRVSGYTAEQISNAIVAGLEQQEFGMQGEVRLKISELSLKIVGYFDAYRYDDLFVSDTVYDYYKSWREKIQAQTGNTMQEDRAEHTNGDYAFVIAPMPKDRATIEALMKLHYAEEGVDLLFQTNNAVMSTLGNFDQIIEVVAKVFIWVGLGLAVFAAFLLMNFIATSISYKKRDIGILRAVGARSSDVFKIFFSEAFIIALINFVLSAVACITVVIVLNTMMRNQGINITLLRFGPLQALLMLAISVFVAFAASFMPVRAIARKKPVDAIKDR